MVNMYYQIFPRKRMPHLYIPGRKNRAVIIPVKHQPPADARLRPFCVELDLGWAYMADMFIGKDEEKLSPKCALRSAKRISDILSILYRIFAPSEENGDGDIDIDLQGDNVKFVPLRWYKDNNDRDVTILSTLWFNNQEGVDNIVMAPLGQEGIVFVDMAYTVTKRGLKLTLVMEMEVNKVKAVQDIMGSFLKISMLDDQTENDGLEESGSSGSPSETSAVLSQKWTQVLADIEKCNEDNTQIVTQHLDELSDSVGDGAVDQHCQAPVNSQERTSEDNVGGEVQVPTNLTPSYRPEKSDPESSGEVQVVLRDKQQMRDENERQTAELKQKLQRLINDARKLTLDQQEFLETIAKEEQDRVVSQEKKRETSGGRVVRRPAYAPPIQDTVVHNYKDQQMLEFQNHLQRRANRTAPQVGTHDPHQEGIGAPGVWRGRPPSSAERKTPHVATLTHYKKTRSTFGIHLGHCHICKKTIEALLHGTRCQEDGCATCQQIAREVAKHITRCTRGTLCPLPICASGVPLGLYCDGTVDETPMFVGLVRLYLRRMFHRG